MQVACIQCRRHEEECLKTLGTLTVRNEIGVS
jgi:hypothetical protein